MLIVTVLPTVAETGGAIHKVLVKGLEGLEIREEKITSYPRKRGRGLEKETNRETECLLLLAQDNAIRTNYIKARINKTQQNSKCKLCGDRDETINRIISECSKLAQKEYKTRYDWVGKVIHCELT